jgi:4a-hydroxytetrahydrobiopterin dehydratase
MTATIDELTRKKCVPCEGGVPKLDRQQAQEQLGALPQWRLSADGLRISRQWQAKDFAAAMVFFDRVAELAEAEGHHPDLHLEGYRQARVELSTHAIGGLSQNDFILAAKIERLPIELKG